MGYGLDFSIKFERSPPCEISDSPLENVQVAIYLGEKCQHTHAHCQLRVTRTPLRSNHSHTKVETDFFLLLFCAGEDSMSMVHGVCGNRGGHGGHGPRNA